MPSSNFVIVGAGLAGAKAAEALLDKGFDGQIILIGEEKHYPYERPPLSKDYLAGKTSRESLAVHNSSWYANHNVNLLLGKTAVRIDRTAHQVELVDGSLLRYDKLLLATGSSPRVLPATANVHYLRRVEDSERLRQNFASASRFVVIGAGWIGLEVAAAARQAGLAVTVLETLELPLLTALGREAAKIFADLHTEHGVDLRLGVRVEEITGTAERATGVRLADGTYLEADVVLAGIGAIPNTRLAEDAGLQVDNGVQVDANLRTSDPDIFAAGDIANAYHPLLNRHIRVEHWANALSQPAVAASGMLGEEAQFAELPYFYTDQYDLGMEYFGYAEGYDQVVFRGNVATREFIAFWLKDNRVLAGMNVNVWDVGEQIKALIRSGQPVDTERLADPAVPLDEL